MAQNKSVCHGVSMGGVQNPYLRADVPNTVRQPSRNHTSFSISASLVKVSHRIDKDVLDVLLWWGFRGICH